MVLKERDPAPHTLVLGPDNPVQEGDGEVVIDLEAMGAAWLTKALKSVGPRGPCYRRWCYRRWYFVGQTVERRARTRDYESATEPLSGSVNF